MRQEKQLLLDEIKEKIDTSKALIVTQYKKSPPNRSCDSRLTLRKSDSEFEVVKKRILEKAIEASGFSIDLKSVKGNVGVVFIKENTIEGTKAFCTFSKEKGNLFTILSGRYEEKIYSPDDVKELSKLPTKDEMRAQFLGLLEAPMSQTLSVMDSLLTSVMHCLENKSKESNQT